MSARVWCLLVFFSFTSLNSSVLASSQINAFEFKGLERTNEDWLREYIDLELPAQVSEENVEYIKDRLMNTRVFRSVDVYVSNDKLVIDVAEKWTTIPVIRAEVGGGTPLIVAGVYDQHSFGRLITLGGEFRKYGNEKPGFVVWAKSPKHKAGRYSIGIEYWEDIRKRTFYDENGNEQANFTDRGRRLQGYQLFENNFLKDLFSNIDTRKTFNIKLGYNLELRQRDSSDFEIVDEDFDEAAPEKGESIKASIQLITDDILVTGYELDGLKTFWEAGAQVDKKNAHSFYGFELFGYKMMRPFNLASHISLDTNQSTNAADLLFLGGFSSVRGFLMVSKGVTTDTL